MPDNDDIVDDDDEWLTVDPPAQPSVMTDPARLAARLLLETAFREAGTDSAAAGADGLIVLIQVPDAGWTDPVYQVWLADVRGGDTPDDGFQRNYRSHRTWTTWVADERESKAVMEAAT